MWRKNAVIDGDVIVVFARALREKAMVWFRVLFECMLHLLDSNVWSGVNWCCLSISK